MNAQQLEGDLPCASSPKQEQGARNVSLRTASQLSPDHTGGTALDVLDPEPTRNHEVLRPRVTTKGWNLNDILNLSPNFRRMRRINYSSPAAMSDMTGYEKTGIPLIVQGWNRHPKWAKTIFNVEWLRENGDQNPSVRNVHNWMDFHLPIDAFIEKLRTSSMFAEPNETERLYGKDGECPVAWTKWLTSKDVIPEELLFDGSNDFLKFLPETGKVQTLMCYMGIGDTFTPFHKDLCASSGHNLMCHTENGGSSYWFMTKASDASRVASYFHDLGQELDLETHVVTIDELAKAPFDVYIGEQTLGDLVLVPPRSCHQVINHGGITVKTSWSRMSLEGLQVALWHELPIYHRVCRSEIYKVKSNIYHALRHYTDTAKKLPGGCPEEGRAVTVERLKRLFLLFDDVLAEEFSTAHDSMPHISQSGSSHNDDMTCDFCAADIFQSFFECEKCAPPSSSRSPEDVVTLGDGLILCPSCYVEGRTCRCGQMEPVQCRPFNDLLQTRDRAMEVICDADSSFTVGHGLLSEHPSCLLSNQHAGIFEAACRLFQQRQSTSKPTKSCRLGRPTSPHTVDRCAAVYCKPCHSSTCYTHLLHHNSVHSIEAIFVSELYEGGAGWHQHHRDTTQKFKSSEQRIVEDEEHGNRPDMLLRLTHLAKKFDNCRVVNPELTTYGWYDRYFQPIAIPIAKSPEKVLVGLPDDADDDATFSKASGSASPGASMKSGARSRGLVIRIPPRQAPQRDSPLPGASVIAVREEARITDRQSLSSDLTFASIRGSSVPPPSRESSRESSVASVSVMERGQLANVDVKMVTGAAPPFTAVSSRGEREVSPSISDLTELPTEYNSSPLTQPPFDMHSMSVVNSSPSVALPAIFSRRKPRQRVFMECVEIARPPWHKKVRVRPKDVTVSSFQKKRKRLDASVSDDDVPINELSRSMFFAPVGSRPTSGRRIEPSISPDVPNPPLSRQLVVPELQHSLPRKRKLSQSTGSRHPSSRKRTRSVTVVPDSSSETNILANALNDTFKRNSGARSRGERILDDTETRPQANGDTNQKGPRNHIHTPKTTVDPPEKHEKERYYRDIGVDTRLSFKKILPTIMASGHTDTIAKLEAKVSDLEMALERVRKENDAYRTRDEEWRIAHTKISLVPPQTPSVTSHAPAYPTSHSIPHSLSRAVPPDATLTSLGIDQQPQFPPIETLPPATPTPFADPPRRESATVMQPRRHTPTEPRSHRQGNGYDRGWHQPRERGFLGRGPKKSYRRKLPSTRPGSNEQHISRRLNKSTARDSRSPSPPPSTESHSNGPAVHGHKRPHVSTL